MRPLLKNKRGQGGGFIAWFFVLVILLGVTIFLLVANYAWGQIEDPLAAGLNSSVPTADAGLINTPLQQTGGGVAFFDNLLPFLLIGIFGFVMISAGAIMRSPVMIFVGVIIFGVLLTLAVIYSNVYGNLLDSELGTASDSVTIGGLFMRYLPFVLVITIFVVIIATSTRGAGGSSSL